MNPRHDESLGEAKDPDGTERFRLEDGRKVPLRLRPEAWQSGYRGVARDEASERVELADLAGLVAQEAGPIGPHRDTGKNARVYRQGAYLYVGMQEAREAGADSLEALERAIAAEPEMLGEAGSAALQACARLGAVEDLLRGYDPNFDQKPRYERLILLIHGARHMDRAWWARDALRELAQGGNPKGRARRKCADPLLDMRAAELRDALGLPYRGIGEILGIPLSSSDEHKGSHKTVSNTVRRGRAMLIKRLGEDGYRQRIEDLRRWHELDDRQRILQRMIEITAGLTDRPLEEIEVMRPRFERLVNEHLSNHSRI